MGACCGKGGVSVDVGKGFEQAEVQFVWPSKKDIPDQITYRSASFKALVKKFDEVKYDGPHRTRVTLPKGEYNSVWKIGKVKYVVPEKVAPTLLRKILESDAIKSKLDMFGLKGIYEKLLEQFKAGNDPQLSDLPDGKFKDALVLLEGALPVNKWAVEPSVKVQRGKYEGDERIMSSMEKFAEEADKKMSEPAMQIAAARLKKKVAVEAIKAAFNQLGISLDEILGNIFELFGVDPPQLDLDAKIEDMKCDILEPLSEDEKAQLETGTAEFKSTALARYCVATDNTRVPIRFEWRGPAEKAAVRFWKWSEKVKASAPQVSEFVPVKNDKGEVVPNKFETTVQLSPGRWAYQFEVDGAVFWDFGAPVPVEKKDNSYRVMEVLAVKPIFV